jgi:hypothetical protein
MSKDYIGLQGLEWPKCDRVYSPTTEMCRGGNINNSKPYKNIRM